MLIKVCGMRDTDNIRAVSELDIDLMGFIFWPQSPRFVRMISSQAGIIPDYSLERLKKGQGKDDSPANRIKRVGVFVDDMPQSIITRVYNYDLDYVQLHGEESRVMIENFRRSVDPDIKAGIKVIKTISVEKPEDVDKYKEYVGVVDLFLFDTKCDCAGGSGEQFDWSVLERYDGDVPFLLSGGIGPDDVEKIKAFNHPQFAGIDLNSHFETEPGVKDVDKLKAFISALR
ncbi:MAG: phosphoribosylanthranilate isomerase [Prevotella sp.]|nr:phosphoribosylanthranilate isomerase [Prevotella sp.]MBQ6211096.1 phosphoribosylanthranilate isomerase [Prevotella sp.]